MNRIHLKFVLYTVRTNAEGALRVYLFANINSESNYFSLNLLIPKNAWNKKRQEVRSLYPDRNLINADLFHSQY
jgi:hypothetical protein